MAHREPTIAELEAAHWLLVMDGPSPAREEIERFQAWLALDDANKRAYDAVAKTSDKIDAYLARATHLRASDPAPSRERTQPGWIAGAALATACAALLLVFLFRPSDPFSSDGARIYAASSQTELVRLNDGSTIELSPGARVRVVLAEDSRRVRFDEGVALFTVARDADRPFFVSTRFGEIRVTGTSFVVRLNQHRAVTTVLSGRVEARRRSVWMQDSAPDAVGVANFEIVLANDGVSVSALQHDTLAQRLIWRDRMVALDGQTLREAAAEITRFSGAHFIFANNETGDIRLSGYVAGDDVEGFLALLAANVGVDSERRADGAVVLRHRANE
jgi:transmembrane sensor